MRIDMRFFTCKHCGNIIGFVKDKGVPILCCGEKMSEIVAGSTDAAVEKHVPSVTIEGNIVKVQVGSVPHPMTEEHFIEWISLHSKEGNQRKGLSPSDEPCACFALCDNDSVEIVYAYCNLHGLWKAEL